jgi:uncharacterized protein (TIGR02301 family)
MRVVFPAVALLAAALLVAALPVQAQQRPATPPAAAPPLPPQAPAPEPLPPLYEPDLLQLAEIIGAVAFLREICAGPEAAQWRARMIDILEAEGVTQGRKERLAGAYNRGYRGYALTYRSCTSAAEEAAARLTRDGERLSRSIAGRFGG